MQSVGRGDENAFATLIRRYQKPLLNFFRRMGVYTEAEDLVQETFLRLFRYRRRYRPAAAFRTFLYRIAGQVRVDHLRKVKRREDVYRTWVERQAPAGEALPHDKDDPRTSAAVAALARLPEPLRQVLVLRLYQDLAYKEIADVLDIPVGTVKSRIFNGLKTIREVLDARSERP
jgi:RNA polymerase sigma-70 factor (ECF subfamily)